VKKKLRAQLASTEFFFTQTGPAGTIFDMRIPPFKKSGGFQIFGEFRDSD
jgi:hypothetical protein